MDCYYNIVIRLLAKQKIEKADGILNNVFATIEKIEPGEKSLTHGLMLRHDLSRLKLIRADLRREKAREPIRLNRIAELIKNGYEMACETFRNLLRKKDQVRYFLTNLECLSYLCYFSVSMENVSQTFQFATVIKGLVEAFIKKIGSDDKNNLLVEIMIFCKKYQISKEQRFELYHLLVVTLVLYSSALFQTEQWTKSLLFLDKVLALLKTIEPEGSLYPVITNLRLQYQSQSEKMALAAPNENYQIKVITDGQEEGSQVGASNVNLGEEEESCYNPRSPLTRKKVLSKSKAKMTALTNGLFIPGFNDGKVTEDIFKKFSETWATKVRKERGISMKQTVNKAYKQLGVAVAEDEGKLNQRTPVVRGQLKALTREVSQTAIKNQIDNNVARSNSVCANDKSPKKIARIGSFDATIKKAFIRPRTVSFARSKSQKSQSFSQYVRKSGNSIKATNLDKELSGGDKKPRTTSKSEMKGSVIYLDNKRETTEGFEFTDEERKGGKKPKSIVKQLQNLLYKAGSRERMSNNHIFNSHETLKTVGVKQNRWVHDHHTTKTSDSNTGFSISKEWFYDRMMADRLKDDKDRVLTNNMTMNIKNHQVMIEFKTGIHEKTTLPKQRFSNTNHQKEYLIKCNLLGDHKDVFMKKGVPFGYLDHQIDDRKKEYNESKQASRIAKSSNPSVAHSRSQSALHVRKPSKDSNVKSQSKLPESKHKLKTVFSALGSAQPKPQVACPSQANVNKAIKLSEEDNEKLLAVHSKEDNPVERKLG